ncbi:phospholipid carrier-dependent glycosyltransferase [Planctomycetota bacterium]|nr:phospholipid carrier-dependent glycosyltransferase [Planctomycetota bacterium]
MPESRFHNKNRQQLDRTMFYGGQWYALTENNPSPSSPDPDQPQSNVPSSDNDLTPPVSSGSTGKQPSLPQHDSSHTTPRRRDISKPPRSRSKVAMWLTLVACIVLTAVPIFIDFNSGSVIEKEEARTIWTSIETWELMKAMPFTQLALDPFVPVYNARTQLTAPPAGNWLQIITFAIDDFFTEKLTTADYISDARLTSAIFALLAVAAVYWIGFSIGGNWLTAVFAAGILASNPIFLYYARLGTSDMPTTSFMILSIAGALWAVRPLRPTAVLGRQALGWTFCGLMMGLAILSGGPALIGPILLPLFVIMLMCPHRASHLLGLLAAVLIAALLMAPWIVYVQYGENPATWTDWTRTILPTNLASLQNIGKLAIPRLGILFLASTPWIFWLIGGIGQPFSASSVGSRLRLFLGWSWFIIAVIFLVMRPTHHLTQATLLVLPVIAVMLAQMFRQYTILSATGRYPRLWRSLRWPHVGLLLIFSIFLPTAIFFEPLLLQYGYTNVNFAETMHWTYCAGLAFALLALLFISARAAFKHFPTTAVITWSLWGILAFAALIVPLVRGPLYISTIKYNAEQIAHLTANSDQLYYLGGQPDPILILYVGEKIQPISKANAEELLQDGGTIYLLTPEINPDDMPRNYINQGNFPNAGVQLWRGQTRF